MSERYRTRALLAVTAAGTLALAGCASAGATGSDTRNAQRLTISSGFIGTVPDEDEYPFIREQPFRVDDGDGFSANDCARPDVTVPLGSMTIWLSPPTANGRYVGLQLSDLPGDIRQDCEGDSDGIVWVTQSAVLDHVVGPAGDQH